MNIEEIRAQRIARAERRAARRLKWAESAERKATALHEDAQRMSDAIPFGQPILADHYSAKSDKAYRGRIGAKFDKSFEMQKKADYHRQKAENIMIYGTRVKGDAERERQAERERADTLIGVGSTVRDVLYGEGEVLKINKKTYTIRFASGWVTTRDKSHIRFT